MKNPSPKSCSSTLHSNIINDFMIKRDLSPRYMIYTLKSKILLALFKPSSSHRIYSLELSIECLYASSDQWPLNLSSDSRLTHYIVLYQYIYFYRSGPFCNMHLYIKWDSYILDEFFTFGACPMIFLFGTYIWHLYFETYIIL